MYYFVYTGEKWHQRRKILTPAFHFNVLKGFCNIFVERSEKLVEKLHETKGEAVDVLPYVNNFALDVICGNLSVKFSIRNVKFKH